MKTRLHGLFILLALIPSVITAQEKLNFFADSVYVTGHNQVGVVVRENGYLYVGGRSMLKDGYKLTPAIVKLDTAGNTIWSYSLHKEMDAQVANAGTAYGDGGVNRMFVDDENVYACFSGSPNEIWKVNKQTGNLIWKRQVGAQYQIIDYNNSQFILLADGQHGFTYFRVEKDDGSMNFPILIGSPGYPFFNTTVEVDTDGSVYVAKKDTVTKYSNQNLDNILWNKQVVTERAASLIIAKPDGLFVFGSADASFGPNFFGKINKSNGNVIWMSKPGSNAFISDEYISDVKFTDSFVYASGQQTLYGSVFYPFHIWKLNRNTGAWQWDTRYNPSYGTSPKPGLDDAGVNSFDVDAHGNVYVAGYHAASDHHRGRWGVVKYGPDGNMVYYDTLFQDAPFSSGNSRGVYCVYLNNRIYYLGEMQRSPTNGGTDVYVVATDTGSVFKPFKKQKTTARYQDFSAVKRIINYQQSAYVVYSQYGTGIRLQMKNSLTGASVWDTVLRKGAHLTADKIVVTADQKILISCIEQKPYYMQYDYVQNPDSLFFIKFDAAGRIADWKRYSINGVGNFKPIQLYASGDTNNIYIYSINDYYGNPLSVHIFNMDRATDPPGTISDLIGSKFEAREGRQDLFVPKSGDSLMNFETHFNGTNPRWEVYVFDSVVYKNGVRTVEGFNTSLGMTVQNLVKYDSNSVIALGKMANGIQWRIARFNFRNYSTPWMTTEVNTDILEGISVSHNSIYTAGSKGVGGVGKPLLVRRMNPATGATIWQKTIPVGMFFEHYKVLDQQYNPYRHQYVVCGYFGNDTLYADKYKAFYTIFDTVGNIVKHWVEPGDFTLRNQLNIIHITSQGQTLIGGALYKIPHGRSGVLIEADTALKLINPPIAPTITMMHNSSTTNPCVGDTVTLAANSNGCQNCSYQWNDAQSTTNDTLKVTVAGTYTVTVTNSGGSSTANKQILFNTVPAKPAITQSGDSLVSSSANGNQWYRDGSLIAGATSQKYKPTQSGQYTLQVTQNECKSALSTAFTFTITAIIDPTSFGGQVRVWPNPISDKIIVSNKLNRPLVAQLFDITGRPVISTLISANATRELIVASLSKGSYILLLTDKKENKSIRKVLTKGL